MSTIHPVVNRAPYLPLPDSWYALTLSSAAKCPDYPRGCGEYARRPSNAGAVLRHRPGCPFDYETGCTHGADCHRHPGVGGLHDFDGQDAVTDLALHELASAVQNHIDRQPWSRHDPASLQITFNSQLDESWSIRFVVSGDVGAVTWTTVHGSTLAAALDNARGEQLGANS
jgi:hypothetical protein